MSNTIKRMFCKFDKSISWYWFFIDVFVTKFCFNFHKLSLVWSLKIAVYASFCRTLKIYMMENPSETPVTLKWQFEQSWVTHRSQCGLTFIDVLQNYQHIWCIFFHVYMYFWQVNSLSRSICRQVETSCIAPLISTTDKTPQRAYLQYMTDFLLHPHPPHPLTILLQYLWCFYNLIIRFKNL